MYEDDELEELVTLLRAALTKDQIRTMVRTARHDLRAKRSHYVIHIAARRTRSRRWRAGTRRAKRLTGGGW